MKYLFIFEHEFTYILYILLNICYFYFFILLTYFLTVCNIYICLRHISPCTLSYELTQQVD